LTLPIIENLLVTNGYFLKNISTKACFFDYYFRHPIRTPSRFLDAME